MHALPLVIALVIATVLARPLLGMLRAGDHTAPNYRGRELPVPFGVLVPATALIALVPVTLVERLTDTRILSPELLPAGVYVLGVAFLGLVDDTLGDDTLGGAAPPTRAWTGVTEGSWGCSEGAPTRARTGMTGGRTGVTESTRDCSERAPARARGVPFGSPRGWRGHGGALLRGELSTGALKAAGTLGLALVVTDIQGFSRGRWLLATAVVVLATNVFNLLDLRPGRAVKAFALLAVGLTVGAREVRSLWTLGLFVGPMLIAGFYDLRERAMLGDTGANALGALAGLWLVWTLSSTGQLIALAILLSLTVYGELRSISEAIERLPLLRGLDSWGRPS
jgi:hypothetical protein